MKSPRSFHESRFAGSGGFSLIEIALALGVVAIALVAILGLLPVALDAAQESRNQARATFISQLVFGDLRSGVYTNAPVTTVLEANGTQTQAALDLSTNATHSFYVAYDESGRPMANLTSAQFALGFGGSAARPAAFLAQITGGPHDSIPNLARLEASVEQPAQAADANRRRYYFTTLIPQ